MMLTNEIELKENGFFGFIPVSELQKNKCRDVPNNKGVYVILRTANLEPKFKVISSGGHFKGRNPSISIPTLRKKWVDDAKVLYVGKAGSMVGNSNLKNRLRQYMDFGQGLIVGHWGGRYIWQLTDSNSLKVCWKSTPNENPRTVEKYLIQEFMNSYSKLPFANLRR